MKKFNVQITYAGMIEETIEAESLNRLHLIGQIL
ncbi:phage protein [Staphylococcus aureus]|nr:phage protein [Staphylococcus aureus]CAC8795326.1 phage protein [Staphylococcus aureus]CAC9396140.1 phage protein [Staphylococcus aureus]CXK84297.1 phage protein [Staphylococcus aureus]SAO10460.1 phage protein [Staphylococcus aureus]